MPCDARYAESRQFAEFWFTGWTILSTADVVGLAQPNLIDNKVDFREIGVTGDDGMQVWNLTQVTDGIVTAVPASRTLTVPGVTWDANDSYRLSLLTVPERSAIEVALDLAAGDVYASLASVGACDCTLADWAATMLAKINIIDAGAYYHGQCGSPKFTDEMRRSYLEFAQEFLGQIRTGEVEVCQGATAKGYPAMAIARNAPTIFQAARETWIEDNP